MFALAIPSAVADVGALDDQYLNFELLDKILEVT